MKPLAVVLGLLALGLAGSVAFPAAAGNSNLAYDEIVKFNLTASPPPPGSFSADYAAITSPQTAQTNAPRKRGLFGSIDVGSLAHAVANGGNPSSLAAGTANNSITGAKDAALDNAIDGMLAKSMQPIANSLSRFANGTLERHAFYNNWERIDDVADGTATILKCDLHQRIVLDLNHKTYRVEDPTAQTTAAVPSHATTSHGDCASNQTAMSKEQPGTGTISITNRTTDLPTMRLDGTSAPGVSASTTIAIEHATGSCKNGSFTVATTTYYSQYPVPHAFCPLPRALQHPQTPAQMVTRPDAGGGCRLTTAMHVSPGAAAHTELPLYELMSMGASTQSASAPAGAMSFVTERGNVRPLGASDAGLFDIPAGFTKAP